MCHCRDRAPRPGRNHTPFAEAAGPDFDAADVTSAPSDCNRRLATITSIELLPRLIGPGVCGSRDMIELNAVLLPDDRRIRSQTCGGPALPDGRSFAAWLRDEVSAHTTSLGAALRGVETYGSYECRGRNGVPDAKPSEHGKGNAVDVRAFVLADGRRIGLTDTTIAKPLREELRDSACHRFATV